MEKDNHTDRPIVVLVYPKTGWDIKNVTTLLPLSILYLVRPLVRAGFEPVLIDQRIDDHWAQTLKTYVNDKRTVLVGISAMTGLQIQWGLAAAGIARKRAGLPIVWGGVHASLLPEQTLQSEWVDFVVAGEGETPLPLLADAIARNLPTNDIPGLCYLQGQAMVRNDAPPPVDLDDLLIPDYDAVNVGDYLTTQTLGMTDIAVTTSRGCPNRCRYCYNIPYSGRRWRAQSAEKVIEHFQRIHRDFGVSGILVKDDNFFVDRKRAEAIAKGLGRLGNPVTVRAECRADYIAQKWDPDFLPFLAAHGFKEMTVGAESGSDEVLGLLCKDITVDDIRTANRRLGAAKIASKFTFMTGYPGETLAQTRQTLDLMLDLVRENRYARVTPLHLFAPYPGTDLYDESVTKGYTPPVDLEGWAHVNFHNLRLPWIDADRSKKLERASVATYFLDGRTVPEYFSKSWFMKTAAKIYGAVVRFRAARFFFSFMPELALFEWVRKHKKMI